MSQPPLIQIAEDLFVSQVPRAVWYSTGDKQTHIRVDDRCTIVVGGDKVAEVIRAWQEGGFREPV